MLFGGFCFGLVSVTLTEVYLWADLVCISLMAKDVEHFLMHLLTIANFFLRTVFSSLSHLLIGCFIFGV